MGTGGSGGGSQASACKGKAPTYGPTPLRRLTEDEYKNSLRALFGDEVVASAGAAVDIADAKGANSFGVQAQNVTASQIDGSFDAADTLADKLTSSPQRLAALTPCLGQSPITEACAKTFIETVGRKMFRRPLAAEENTAWLGAFREGQAIGSGKGVYLVLLGFLQSLDFLYRPETAGTPVAGAPDLLTLNEFELATRISFLIVGATPDDKLLDAAAGGTLKTEAGLGAQVDRLLDDPRAKTWIKTFANDWLQLDDVEEPQQSATFLAGISKTGLVEEMRKEINAFVVHQAFGGRFSDLMTSPMSFVTSANLAKIYGINAGTGDGKVMLPEGKRNGLLTRAAMLVYGTNATVPPRRGKLVRFGLLCSPLPPPPGDVDLSPPPIDANNPQPAPVRWTAKTSGAECSACHQAINPFGFALENYDTLGRYRDQETVYDSPTTDKVVAKLPIEPNVEVPVDGKMVKVAGAAGLGALLAETRSAQTCFASEWLRFAFAREKASEDGCLVEELADTAVGADGIKGMFRRTALAPAMRVYRASR